MNISVRRENGQLGIDIGGKFYPPLAFKSFRANPRNVGEVYASGVRLFTVLSSGVISGLGVPYSRYGESWVGDGKYDFAPVDAQMEMFLANAPEGYFAPMFQIDTRPWYLDERPDCPNSFTHLSQIAGDHDFRKAVSDYLRAVVSHCEEKYGDRIFGYFLLGGTTTEWFSDYDREASHPMKEKAFREWKHDDTARLPDAERLERPGPVFLSAEEEDVREARQFHAELISDLILSCAKTVNAVTGHRKLLGLYYGYLFELGTPRLHNAGSLAYEKIFTSDEVDMISSPSSYGYRGLSDPSAFMVTARSLEARNKLYFLEFDHRTHTVPMQISEEIDVNDRNTIFKTGIFPGAENKCASETDSINLMYRDFLLCQANNAALWWFDMFDGWFRSEGMLDAIRHMTEIDRALAGYEKHSAAEVAVFAEGGASMYRVRKSAPIASACLNGFRRTLAEAGAPYDLYSTFDLHSLPGLDRYRFYIFLNAYEISKETRRALSEICEKDGKTVLWLYAPDYAADAENAASRMTAVTGIRTEESPSSCGKLVWDGQPLFDAAEPNFIVTDPDAEILARYENGLPAIAEKTLDGWNSVYSALYRLPTSLLTALYRKHGVFVYSDNPRVYTYVNSAMLGVYNAADADAEISVPADGVYRDRIGGGTYASENGVLRLPQKALRAYLLVRE